MKNNNNYKDVYQRVTGFVLEQLEKGSLIWQQGWHRYGLPKNIITGKTYRGWNVFFLNFITLSHSFTTPYFLTFRQAQQEGGRIKKAAKGFPVVYWAAIESKQQGLSEEEENREEQEETSFIYLVPKLHTVLTKPKEFPFLK